jgi:hypothetical protein
VQPCGWITNHDQEAVVLCYQQRTSRNCTASNLLILVVWIKICNDCGAKHWKAELPSDCTLNNIYWTSCCKAGQVKIDILKEPSAYLKDLFDDNSTRGQNFKKNIRRYNAAFAFTSLKCDTPHINESNMPFQIHGQMYHMQGPLSTDDPSKAKYA